MSDVASSQVKQESRSSQKQDSQKQDSQKQKTIVRKGHLTIGTHPNDPSSPSNSKEGKESKKSQKQMTKQERRELQERQRAEKASRMNASSTSNTNTNTNNTNESKKPILSNQSSIADLKANAQVTSATRSTPLDMRADDSKKRSKAKNASGLYKTKAKKPVALFSHLDQYERIDTSLNVSSQDIIHPSIRSLGLAFSEFLISGGNARCVAMLTAFKIVIEEYSTPSGTVLKRHLTYYLSKQVDFLSNARCLSASMKTAIKFIKNQISELSIDLPDEDAKLSLKSIIDKFIEENIEIADKVIINTILDNRKVKDGDVILTFGFSSLVLGLLLTLKERGMNVQVIVVDARPKLEGRELLDRLASAGISCSYALVNALPLVMKEATKVILGASAVFSNGAVMSRVGSSLAAMMGHQYRKPVIILCEAYKFSGAVRLDSFVWNEIGNPQELVDISNCSPSFKLPGIVPRLSESREGSLSQWKDVGPLKLLNIHYDVTPVKFITLVACQLGLIPAQSCVSVFREMGGIQGLDGNL